MKNAKLKYSFLATILMLLINESALATVVNLNNIPLNFRFQNLPSYTEGNFNISASCTNCSNVFSTVEPNAGYPTSTGALGWGASGRFLETWNTSVVFTLTETSGANFNFTGFDIGWFNNATSNANWDVRAYDALGNLLADDTYVGRGHFDFNYRSVASIELQNNGGFSSFDNLVVSVPEPSTLALLGLGMIGLGFARRRKS